MPSSAPRPTTPSRCPHAPFTAPAPGRVSSASSASRTPRPPAMAAPGTGQRERDRARGRRCSRPGTGCWGPVSAGQGPPRAQPIGGRPDGDSSVPRQSSSAEHPAEQTDRWTPRRVPQGCSDGLGLRRPLERARGRAGVGAAGAGEHQCWGGRQPPPRLRAPARDKCQPEPRMAQLCLVTGDAAQPRRSLVPVAALGRTGVIPRTGRVRLLWGSQHLCSLCWDRRW